MVGVDLCGLDMGQEGTEAVRFMEGKRWMCKDGLRLLDGEWTNTLAAVGSLKESSDQRQPGSTI